MSITGAPLHGLWRIRFFLAFVFAYMNALVAAPGAMRKRRPHSVRITIAWRSAGAVLFRHPRNDQEKRSHLELASKHAASMKEGKGVTKSGS